MPPSMAMPLLTLFAACVAFSAVGVASARAGSLPAAKWAPYMSGGAAALDRIAYAVDGAESTHGADPKMWRPDPDGPQGPMQVSAAAAADVGGGDRFDEQQNRALGRAYLAQMYRRYGSWHDAVAAYNWGPGNMDSWISGGRPFDKLPLAVEQYRIRVLLGSGLGLPRLRVANTRLRRLAADPYNGRAAVALLYPTIISASELALR
jgi:Transglycosylase SLT domain